VLTGEGSCQPENSQTMRNTAIEKMNKRLRSNFSKRENQIAFDHNFYRRLRGASFPGKYLKK